MLLPQGAATTGRRAPLRQGAGRRCDSAVVMPMRLWMPIHMLRSMLMLMSMHMLMSIHLPRFMYTQLSVRLLISIVRGILITMLICMHLYTVLFMLISSVEGGRPISSARIASLTHCSVEAPSALRQISLTSRR